jgi:hypothetical protein
MHFGWTFAGEDFGDFQGASEAAVSNWILSERATRKIAKSLPARRVGLKTGWRRRCGSLSSHKGDVRSPRLADSPF